jgi:hypothetical protein
MVLWRLILLLISSFTFGVHSQLDSNGFLSIDCGLPTNSSYVDPGTNLTYLSDEQFIDTGVNFQISNSLPRVFQTVRSFPTGIRNCYTIRSLTPDFKYLIRATFIYSNYDNLNRPPMFDIYLGVNFWDTVNADSPFYPEIIVKSTTADYLQVCLVNKNLGNPFISALHLRQLNSKLYQEANANQSLILVRRADLGERKSSNSFLSFRYPQDKYDRWWFAETLNGTIEISSNSTIEADPDETPSVVMQNAATTSSTQQPLNLYCSVDDKSSTYYWIFHFYEIQPSSTGQREFDLLINGAMESNKIIFQTWYRITVERSGFTNYNVSLVATSNSTLPPLLNAYELYKIAPVGVPTYGVDVAAINSIKQDHQIKQGWSGDPCIPKEFTWTGVSCTSNSSNITRITAMNLSSSGLIGPLSYYFGNLSALVSLDLSSNNLSGSLPRSLDQLTALKYLDIRGNNMISTTLPFGLEKRQQNGSLTYR